MRINQVWAFPLLLVLFAERDTAMAIEEPAYKSVKVEDRFELRAYEPYLVAETVVQAGIEDAGNTAFRTLFAYISGANTSREKVAMTAPVEQRATAPEKIKMTAPVEQQPRDGAWAVSFVMPASYTMDTLPVPQNPNVTLRQVPARTMAVVRYSGTWSAKQYSLHKQELESWIGKNGLRPSGEAVWARYNSPFTLPFLRRNEVMIPVEIEP